MSELKYVLVVVPHHDDAHAVVLSDEGLHQGVYRRIHILSLVDHQHSLGQPALLNLVCLYTQNRALYNLFGLFNTPHFPQQIKAIRVKSFDFNEMSGHPNKRTQSRLKLGSCSA
ncbi:MAG: hypothetical protein DDT38_00949 [Firmicutes bacterium]|nr:hypothetical protein [candidate division NPL-UPA2 bacterium]